MPDVYYHDKVEKLKLKPGQWVRMLSGMYKGDLAKVVIVDQQRKGAHLKFIPRIR